MRSRDEILQALTGGFFIALICLLAGTTGVVADEAPPRTSPFPDVPKTHWAYDAVKSLRRKGVLLGYPPETLKSPAIKRPPQRSKKPRSA